MGNPKKKETFVMAVKSFWKILHQSHGYVNIDFSAPYSLKELVKSINQINKSDESSKGKILTSQASTTSIYGVDQIVDQNRLLVDSVARHVIYDCSKTTVGFSHYRLPEIPELIII